VPDMEKRKQRRAALLGKKVAIIEKRVIGETFVNLGCVKKKLYLILPIFWKKLI
jgi:pyruvate/2-oxoglutarate dehydrogenase complex dihydrolipoamide dehydrogenase (E3) component